MAKYVELSVEGLRTRVQFPPPPPNDDGHPCGGRWHLLRLWIGPRPARTRGFAGHETRTASCRVACESASACRRERALQGQFPPPLWPCRRASAPCKGDSRRPQEHRAAQRRFPTAPKITATLAVAIVTCGSNTLANPVFSQDHLPKCFVLVCDQVFSTLAKVVFIPELQTISTPQIIPI